MVWGQPAQDGFTVVRGKVYDLAYNGDRKDLVIAQKDGDVLLKVETGKITVNKITPQLLETFENANTKVEAILNKRDVEMQH